MVAGNNNGSWQVDNGRLRMRELEGFCYCEGYMADEFGLADVMAIVDFIRDHLGGKADIIYKKDASYSVAVDAQVYLRQGVAEFGNFVYVVDSEVKRASANFAAETYMDSYNTRVCDSVEEACQLLRQSRNS